MLDPSRGMQQASSLLTLPALLLPHPHAGKGGLEAGTPSEVEVKHVFLVF